MSNITIPLLPPVIALSGAEFIEVVQAGTSSRATVSQLASALATYTAGTGLTLSGNQFSITATGAAAGWAAMAGATFTTREAKLLVALALFESVTWQA